VAGPPSRYGATERQHLSPLGAPKSFTEIMGPTGRQREAFARSLHHRFLFYGGRAGGGKSYFLRWWCLRELLRLFGQTGIRGLRVGLFSIDYPTLTDRQISKIAMEFPSYFGKLGQSREEGYNFKLAPRYGSGTIALRNLDDPAKYRSTEFAAIAVEEVTELKAETFDLLRFRLRWPGIDRPNFVAAGQPGNVGHGWVKELWIDGARDENPLSFPVHMRSLFDEFAFVNAGVDDNPHISQTYRDDLQTLPEQLRKAVADGDWTIFEGQYFTEWREEIHVCDEFEIPWFWKIERVGDWGEAKPCAHLLVATSPEGYKYVIGEVYGAGKSIETQSAEIHAMEAGLNVLKYGVLDSACWDTTGRVKSIAQQFEDYGVRWYKCSKGPGSRVARWLMIRRALAFERDATGTVTKQPILKVFRSCVNGRRTLPNLVYNTKKTGNAEDLDTAGEDHWADALGYHFSGADDAPSTPDSEMTEEDAAFLAQARKEGNKQHAERS
jgi:phage terminase large subunit